tara:strand:+ start:33 stop:485 length:453 start_codon:yes stop_codon:yes gene_type:complete
MVHKPIENFGEVKMVKAKVDATRRRGHERVLFGICLAGSLLAMVIFASLLGGYQSLVAAVLSFTVCLLAVVANRTLILIVFKNRLAPAYCTLSGMLLRMALPLSVCLALAWRQSPLLDAGFAYFLIVSYLIILMCDVSNMILKLKIKPAA